MLHTDERETTYWFVCRGGLSSWGWVVGHFPAHDTISSIPSRYQCYHAYARTKAKLWRGPAVRKVPQKRLRAAVKGPPPAPRQQLTSRQMKFHLRA